MIVESYFRNPSTTTFAGFFAYLLGRNLLSLSAIFLILFFGKENRISRKYAMWLALGIVMITSILAVF